jgi:hypothetical protein
MGASIGFQTMLDCEQDNQSDNKPSVEFQHGVVDSSSAAFYPKLPPGNPSILPVLNDLFMWSLKSNAYNLPVSLIRASSRPHFGQLIN